MATVDIRWKADAWLWREHFAREGWRRSATPAKRIKQRKLMRELRTSRKREALEIYKFYFPEGPRSTPPSAWPMIAEYVQKIRKV